MKVMIGERQALTGIFIPIRPIQKRAAKIKDHRLQRGHCCKPPNSSLQVRNIAHSIPPVMGIHVLTLLEKLPNTGYFHSTHSPNSVLSFLLLMDFDKLRGIAKHPSRADNAFYQAPSVIPVGAQLIVAPPIYRPIARRCALQADKSAMCTKH